MALPSTFPAAQGLYNPANEHDACGVAMVATLNKVATHEIVAQALTALRNLDHRGAAGAEPDSGDGAGILIRVPDAFYRAITGFDLPVKGSYATGIAFIQPGFDCAICHAYL
jgi:glutamate synthase (NADPH/NADH) large chain